MGKKKIRFFSFVLALSFFIASATGCRQSEADKTKEPEASPSVSQSLEPSIEPTENPNPAETPVATESPGTTASPETTGNPSETGEPAHTTTPTPTPPGQQTTVPSASPEPTSKPDETFTPSAYTLFPQLSSFELTKIFAMPDIKTASPIMKVKFNNPVTLYASTGPGRPSEIPDGTFSLSSGMTIADASAVFVDEVPIYSNGFRTSFVEKNKDEVLWFAWTTKVETVEKIVFQVSDKPFEDDADNWENPFGLVLSKTITKPQSEFSIDFSELGKTGFTVIGRIGLIKPVENEKVNPTQEVFYVRAVAIDGNNNMIGEPGKGLEILYGDRITYVPGKMILRIPYPLLSGERPGEISTTGEYGNYLTDESLRFYNTGDSSPWYFRPDGFSQHTDTIYMQVTRVEPDPGLDGWRDPSGLVYEMKLEKGEDDFDEFEDPYHAVPIDIKQIAGAPPDLLYIRAVALSDGPVAGTVKAEYSKKVVVKYNYASSEYEYIPPPEVIQIDANTPDVRLMEYRPYRYQMHDWMYYYEVVRQPTYGEYYSLLPPNMVPNINQLVEGLTPGTVIYLEPKEDDDDSWWDKVTDAISDVFGSIANFVADVANWVSEKYKDLKADLIKFVAENLPGVPEDWRDELKQALEYMVDYGLASVGIPPEIPNFDELTDLGADYLAATALEQAGIPADEITKEVVKDLGGEIADHASSAATSGGAPNPMNWNWVRQYPEVMYRPAYMLIEVANNSDEMSPPGWLSGTVFTDITTADKANPDIMTLSSRFGGSLHYELFRPYNLRIPPLYPGQKLEIPVFLKEYTGAAYPFHPHVVTENDFTMMYKYLGDYTFTYYATFEVQPLEDYIEENNLPPVGKERVYEYTNTSDGGSFTRDPSEEYVP